MDNIEAGSSKIARVDIEVIDLTLSSSPAPQDMEIDSPSTPETRDTSPIEYGSTDEHEVCKFCHSKREKTYNCSLILTEKTSYSVQSALNVRQKFFVPKFRLPNQCGLNRSVKDSATMSNILWQILRGTWEHRTKRDTSLEENKGKKAQRRDDGLST
jgi:hypothetical protein